MRTWKIMNSRILVALQRIPGRAAILCLFLFGLVLPAHAELDIVEVTSPKGIKAWLVEDPSDPVVALSFAFVGGSNQEPKGKEGLVGMMVSLLTNGASDLDSDTFQRRLYETGADLSFGAGNDTVGGSLRVLAGETEEPLKLLSLAVTAPRFDEDEFARERTAAISRIRSDSNDPDERGQRELASVLYGDHPLARQATAESLAKLTRDDLAAYHQKLFARSNLIVGVVGAIDPETLGRMLDQVFGDLPEKADLMDVPPPTLKLGQEVRETYDRPQTSIAMVYPGVAATSPELYPATLLAEILGGGGLTSRLFMELREKRGLTYGAGADLDSGMDWGDLSIYVSTSGDRAAETLKVTREVVARMAAEGPTQEELDSAKKYLTGSYALNQLASTSAIADTLVGLQRLGRSKDYVEERVGLINAVTLDEVKAMATRLLSTEPTVLMVGPELQAAD